MARVPWPLLGGLLLACVACVLRARRGRTGRPWSEAAGLVALSAATWLARALALPFTFFHQNGHGPAWIGYLLRPESDGILRCKLLDVYGPGYYELFGAAARVGSDPDRAVFVAQSVFGAFLPALSWLLARRAGARPVVAWSLAVLVALDPFLARIAQSESYFSVCIVLLVGAAAVLAPGDPRTRVGTPGFVIATVASGLLIAQAVRTHPSCWIAAGMVPLAVLVGPGRGAARVRLFLWSALGVGATAGLVSGRIVYRVVTGPFAERMLAHSRVDVRLALLLAVVVLTLGTAIWWSPRRLRVALVAVVVAVISVLVLDVSNVVGNPNAAFDAARMRLCLPVVIAAVATGTGLLARTSRRALVLSALLLTTGVAASIMHWSKASLLPTDALEARWALDWRSGLPPGARVLYLHDVRHENSTLPLYPPETHAEHSAGTPIPELGALGPTPFYYRSSLCSTTEGRPYCDEIESRFELAQISARDLPARPSMFRGSFDGPVVRVALYRITGRRAGRVR